MQTIVITGGTGFVGGALTQALLAKGYQVIILSRTKKNPPATAGLHYAQWDVQKQYIDEEAIQKADYIIHLAGAGVADKRWTKKRKNEILQSRIASSQLLVQALRTTNNKVKAVISASAIGWYGADVQMPNPVPFQEEAPPAHDFLGATCKQWEDSIAPVINLQKRLVKLRIGIVLGKGAGAFHAFQKPLKFGVAAILGSGKQTVSWIHLQDLVNLFITAIENEKWSGVYNAVAPTPVVNKELIVAIAKARKKIYIPFPVPSFFLKLMLGEMSIEVLKSTTVSAQKILQSGYRFMFPTIDKAADDLVK
jgi:uncharacterized protein (TIGR01777 family)